MLQTPISLRTNLLCSVKCNLFTPQLVMDLSNEDLVQEVKQMPPLKVQSLDSFVKKYRMLNKRELQDVLKVSIKDILDIMSESIDCVGCRRR